MTKRQAEMMAWLRGWFACNEHAPSYSEIRDGLGYCSNSSVLRALRILEQCGHVAFDYLDGRRRARSLRLLRPAPTPGLVAGGVAPGAMCDLGIERAARALFDAVLEEDPEADRVVLQSAALGDLDIALAEARSARLTEAGPGEIPV